jgi:hypothetical protein
MTLMKSLLLGSAAGVVVVASAQAADLPTRKGAPAVEYVRICTITVNGKPVVGWTLPNSDTCFRLSGYVTGQVEGGNLYASQTTTYTPGPAPTEVLVSPGPGATGPAGALTTTVIPGTVGGAPSATSPTGVTTIFPVGQVAPGSTPVVSHAKGVFLVPAAPSGTQVAGSSLARPLVGYTTRLNFGFDAVSNTAYGPLVAHAEMQFENGSGFDNTGAGSTYINLAYVTWAGLTAGKAPSFFSFTGGGPAWANFFSPDQQGFNQPDLLAYTASFGGGFSATIAAQSPGSNGDSGGGTYVNDVSGNNAAGLAQGTNYTYNGQRVPDLVANLKVSQGWGSAQVSGVGHYVTVTGFSGAIEKTWGFGVDAGVSFNLPSFGAGDEITFTGAYTENAAWFSGFPDGMWGEEGMVNGNGQQMAIADTYENPDGSWATPKMWTVSSEITHHFSPEFSGSLEGSYGQVRWDGTDALSVVSNSYSWLGGVVAHWDPVKNLDFEFEALYQYAHTDQPLGFLPAGACNATGCAANVAGANPTWHSVGSGFAARFEVTRSW